jgi:hypothetical protein
MTTITNKEQALPVPAEYIESSQRVQLIWLEYLDIEEQTKHKEKEIKNEIVYMLETLESHGYSRTKAIEKIVDDHKHLNGFSTRTIYRQLPDEMKLSHKRELQDLAKSLEQEQQEFQNNTDNKYKDSDLSFGKSENINIKSEDDTPQDDEEGEGTFEIEEKIKEPLVVDLPSPEPEVQDPKIIPFVGQLPKPVLRLAEKIELSPNKLELIKKYSSTSVLKDHHKIQKNLVEDIAPLTIDQAKHTISHKIRDLETGATQRIDGSYYFDYTKRDKIPKKIDRIKHPIQYFLDLMDKIDEVLYIGTGYKITRDDDITSYEPNHISATQKHRFAMLNAMDGRQINMLEDKIEVLRDLLNALDYEIDEVWKNKK